MTAAATRLAPRRTSRAAILANVPAAGVGTAPFAAAVVVACVLPWLLWLAPRPIYRPLRLSLAALAGLAALAWLGERALGLDNPFGRALDAGLAALPWPALTVAALLIWAMLVGRGTSASGAARA